MPKKTKITGQVSSPRSLARRPVVAPQPALPSAPRGPGDPLTNLRDKLTGKIFHAEARRTQLQKGPDGAKTPQLDAVIEALRYVWDAIEEAIKS